MLCIEGDPRHPILASARGVGPELNLARVLEGTVALAEVTQEVALPRAENGRTPPGIVAVALGGAAPTRSTDALAWERLGAALRDAEHQFDLIVIDTAPILLVLALYLASQLRHESLHRHHRDDLHAGLPPP